MASSLAGTLGRIERDELTIIKRADNGDVLSTQLEIGSRPFDIIINAPRKYIRQHLSAMFSGSPARRTWIKTWKMLIRGIPCEWPMLLMESRVRGYPAESLIVFERVPGATLAAVDLDSDRIKSRQTLFFRAGRRLRLIEKLGFTHTDAKSTNWIVFDDPGNGLIPILVDVDGVRHYRWQMMGIERLLRAMRQHPQYTPDDSYHLCRGYAPIRYH